ncbi:MAG: hypothetical protein LC687_01000 [Actinobacteria bacterium]|nr:hypothetical protein [Actinomycetota bacterium]
MIPLETDIYESEITQVGLEVHHFGEGVPDNYWVKSGIASLSCTQVELEELAGLLSSFVEEELRPQRLSKPVFQTVAFSILVIIFFLLGGLILNV